MEGSTPIQCNTRPKNTMDRLEAKFKADGISVFARRHHAAFGGAARGHEPVDVNEIICGLCA